ncbi:MAG: S24 family peptidase [Bacteroidota bacterium]|nr:S24 family peptidase [Bacteroidota bacterium]
MASTIGQKLKQFCSTKFKTKKEFAAALGMSYENLYQYLEDKAKPGSDFIAKLAALNCDLNWLFSQSDEYNYIPLDEASGIKESDRTFYKILGMVPAGKADANKYNDWFEVEDLYFDPKTHFYLKVDEEFGYSMMPIINPGDKVLVSMNSKVKDGDLVAALWDETKGALKTLTYNPDIPDTYVLISYNQAVAPIFVKKDKARIYKVVLIKKKN